MKGLSALVLSMGMLLGGCAMATDLNLKWEWPAERQPALKLAVLVADVGAADKGWFGIKRSPSLVEGIPDPIELKGTVINGDRSLLQKSITITLPRLEAESIGKGDFAAIGVLDNNVCICIKKLATADEDLSDWQC